MKSTDSLLERIVQNLARHYAHALLLSHIKETVPEAANNNTPPQPGNGQTYIDPSRAEPSAQADSVRSVNQLPHRQFKSDR